MIKPQEELISEEQKILDDLIKDMDKALMKLNKKMTYDELQAKKAKGLCLPDAYGMLISAEQDKIAARQQIQSLQRGKEELYETRLVVEMTDEEGVEKEDIKIGLHTYLNGSRIFIMSWKMPLCRHYILDNFSQEYDGIVVSGKG